MLSLIPTARQAPGVKDNSLQLARFHFLVNALRAALPESSIWHDKLSASLQLDALTLVSEGGMYSVVAYDLTDSRLPQREDLFRTGDLGLAIHHLAHTRRTLTESDVIEIVQRANRSFESLLAEDPHAVTARFQRVTCLMEFVPREENINEQGRRLFGQIGKQLQWPVRYTPFEPRQIFLPSSPAWDCVEDRTGIHRAAEFEFDVRVPVDLVVRQLHTVIPSNGSLFAPGIRTEFAAIPEIQALQFIGRHF